MPTIFHSNYSITHIFLRTLRNETLSLSMESSATIQELKNIIQKKYNMPVETQQLFHQGRLLKSKKCLAAYKLNAKSTIDHPILLTQKFNVQVFISTKVLSLYSLTVKKDSVKKNKTKMSELPSQATIECGSTTSIHTILESLNLSHLAHLVKVCVGSNSEDIKDMKAKVINLPNILNDGIISILFSARWFLDRTVGLATLNNMMSQVIQKATNSSKLLKSCISFKRLSHRFEKTQSFILAQFKELEQRMKQQAHEISKALKWIQQIICNNAAHKISVHAQKLLDQLENKVEKISDALVLSQKKWKRKRKQIVVYLQRTLRCTENEIMTSFRSWTPKDVIQFLKYMDQRIVLSKDAIKCFECANINGYNLEDVNCLSLKLMGIKDMECRVLIVGYIDNLVKDYGERPSLVISDSYHEEDHAHNENSNGSNLCCICVTNEVNTCISPCGHAAYCSECSQQSFEHSDKCPICREKIGQIITVYKAGFERLYL